VTTEGRALDAFWGKLERLPVESMLALAAQPTDPDAHSETVARAATAADDAGLTATIAAAKTDIDEWVIRLYNSSTAQPGWYEANWGRPGTTEDRANLAASLGEVVTAILLGDRIDDEDRDELLGAWAELAA
jgi:hypothetical protein